eukprot:3073093-Rhodomonas_salina.1
MGTDRGGADPVLAGVVLLEHVEQAPLLDLRLHHLHHLPFPRFTPDSPTVQPDSPTVEPDSPTVQPQLLSPIPRLCSPIPQLLSPIPRLCSPIPRFRSRVLTPSYTPLTSRDQPHHIPPSSNLIHPHHTHPSPLST